MSYSHCMGCVGGPTKGTGAARSSELNINTHFKRCFYDLLGFFDKIDWIGREEERKEDRREKGGGRRKKGRREKGGRGEGRRKPGRRRGYQVLTLFPPSRYVPTHALPT